jgi:hypothetical protein
MMVLCLGFLDTIGRYSYQYIGWWSYLTGIPGTILNILKHIVIIIFILIHRLAKQQQTNKQTKTGKQTQKQ